ncbi:MAG: RNA polymerase-binding protein DksA, partial [Thiohalophilus sp.]|uniref:RNA polymerase-binding protein DksA n=1 Tax=Thiohalophilus sp. TaxID=3028392 RepID=UPI00286FB474
MPCPVEFHDFHAVKRPPHKTVGKKPLVRPRVYCACGRILVEKRVIFYGTVSARRPLHMAAKKKTAKKKTAKKATAKKKTSKKKPAAKKTTAKKKTVAKKKTAAKKSTAKKKAVAKKKPTAKKTAKKTAPRKSVTEHAGEITPYQMKKGEEYMNEPMSQHFREILHNWKRELMEEVDRTVHHMQDEAANFPDPNDRASQESDFTMELRTRDRERKLIKKIDESLNAIDNGEYGYCEQCGIEIGIRRLEARPTATLCIDCKSLDEIRER